MLGGNSRSWGTGLIRKGGEGLMKRVISILLGLAILTVFSLGCAGVAKDTKVKCPKCGAIFEVNEGLMEWRGTR